MSVVPQLLITGTRYGRADVWRELDSYVVLHGRPSRVIAGGARGVDTQAAAWARARELPLLEVPVAGDEWEDFGARAGFLRNSVLVAHCSTADHCVAFPARGKSSGTRSCIRLARQLPMLTYVLDLKSPYVFVPGEPSSVSMASRCARIFSQTSL